MKETFFFSHDYNSRNDPKMVALHMKYGCEGWGIYWSIVEMLYEQNGYIMLSECEGIAHALHSECEKVSRIIHGTYTQNESQKLFKNDGEKFWSESVLARMEKRLLKSITARESANKRWGKSDGNANELPSQSEGNAIKVKEIKLKKSKVEKEKAKKESPGTKKIPETNHPVTDKSQIGISPGAASDANALPSQSDRMRRVITSAPIEIFLDFQPNGTMTSREISKLLDQNLDSILSLTNLRGKPVDFISFFFEEFFRNIIAESQDYAEGRIRKEMIYAVNNRMQQYEKTFNDIGKSIDWFSAQVSKLSGDADLIKKFSDYYLADQPSGKKLFQTINNFDVKTKFASWVVNEKTNSNGTTRKPKEHNVGKTMEFDKF